MMKPIEVIGNSYVHGSYQLLGDSTDRVRASLYFADLCEEESKKHDEIKSRWYFRASLSEFKSIFDVLNADFKELGVSKLWKESEFKETLDNNVLVKILSKARDLAIHSVTLKGNHKIKKWQYFNENGQVPIECNSLFFDKIIKENLNGNIRHISQLELDWFNTESEQWPAYLLVREAIYQSSIPIANFLVVNRRYISL